MPQFPIPNIVCLAYVTSNSLRAGTISYNLFIQSLAQWDPDLSQCRKGYHKNNSSSNNNHANS